MKKFDFKAELNEEQYEAVTWEYSPSVVIAGAGSGKTRVITYRIAYLLNNGVNAINILGLTFTNKAANEMKERIAALIDNERVTRYLMLGTFHSVFNKILRREAGVLGYNRDYTIYSPEDAYILIREIVASMGLDNKKYDYRAVYKRISYLKNYMYTPERYMANEDLIRNDKINKIGNFVDVYDRYEKKKRENNAMDFDDLLLNTYFLLKKYEDIRSKYKNLYSHILVDEFQDTNIVQYEITKLLAGKDDDIMVVGDDAQSIYSFRGANLQNVYSFIREYNAKKFLLKRNYRSTQHIVQASNHLINKNKEQIKKEVYSLKGYGNKILIKETEFDSEEAEFVAKDIKSRLYLERKEYKDFAVLYRTNSQSRKIEEALRRENIPYRVYGGTSFYNRKEIKDVLAYLTFLINPDDTVSFKRIVNFPKRGIGDSSVAKVFDYMTQTGKSLSEALNELDKIPLPARSKKQLKDFLSELNKFFADLDSVPVATLTKELTQKFGIQEYLKSQNEEEKAANVDELINSMADFEAAAAEMDEGQETVDVTVKAYLESVSLITDLDSDDEEENKVRIMTAHTAKGLEFPTVYIVGAEENYFPISQSKDSQDRINEERRLFYVAMTRAMENLIITYSKVRYQYNNIDYRNPSRFLKDLPSGHIKFEGTGSLFDNDYRQQRTTAETYFSEKRIATKPTVTQKTTSTPPKENLKKINSRISTEIEQYGNIKPGTRVKHEKFGMGTVEKLLGNPPDTRAIINFDTQGQKTLLLKYARLMVVG